MEDAGTDVIELAAATTLDVRLLKAIVNGNYTPSPQQRRDYPQLSAFR